MKKFLIPSVAAFGLMACSETQETIVYQDVPSVTYTKSDGVSLWQHLDEEGVAEYFEDIGTMPAEWATPATSNKCENGLRMDDNTLYLDEMEGIFQEGTLVDGVCGKAVSLKSGEVAPLSVNLINKMDAGTVEFWFKPGEDFFDKSSRTLLGNDEARIHFFVQDNRLIFQKNHADEHLFVEGSFQFREGWNKIAGQWGDGYMSIWLNDSLVAKKAHTLGYEPSRRGVQFGNLLVIGYKSRCCMEGPGQFEAMTTSGAYDQIRISNIPRYSILDDMEVPADSSEEIASSSSINEAASSASEDVPFVPMDPPTLDELPDTNGCVKSLIIFFEDFDQDTSYGVSLTPGVTGNAGTFTKGDKLVLSALNDSIPQGTFEFQFKPGESFSQMSNAALVGSDEARLSFMMEDGKLCFYKNLADDIINVCAVVSLMDDWNKIAGQWDGRSISLYVNDTLQASRGTNTGYSPSTRDTYDAPYGNAIVVGYKTDCCTSNNQTLYTDGSFDDILITGDLLY